MPLSRLHAVSHTSAEAVRFSPRFYIQALPHARLEVAQNAASAMHFECEGVLAVLGHTSSIATLALDQLKLPRLSIVDKLNAQAQLALSFVPD